MPTINLIDYGLNNIASVQRALEFGGAKVRVINIDGAFQVKSKERVVLPGIGAFPTAMRKLRAMNIVEKLFDIANEGVPVLGICLGLQLLCETSSEFGHSDGIGLIKAEVKPLKSLVPEGEKIKIPHIGWNKVLKAQGFDGHPIFNQESGSNDDKYYFVHSFFVSPADRKDLIAVCEYKNIQIPSIVGHENIIGVQFHPEKSGMAGLNLLKRFLAV